MTRAVVPAITRGARVRRAVVLAVEELEGRRLLSGSVTITPTTSISGNTNLTTEGNLDWLDIGYPATPTKVHIKNGVTGARLGSVMTIGGGSAVAATTPGKTFTWTDATPPIGTDVTASGDPVTRVDGQNDGDQAGVPPTGEEELHAFDNNTQKYLNFQDLNSGIIVTPSANGGNGMVVNGIRLYTANDAIERDPASYTLEGSSNGGSTWTMISGGPLALPNNRNASGHVPDPAVDYNQTVLFSNSTSYKSYRIIFPTLKNATAANSMQIGEIELLNSVPAENATATSDAAAVSGNGNGFHFTVPAGPVLRRLKVYVGVDGGGTGTLTTTLSDGSVSAQTASIVDSNAGGPTLAVFTIDFKSTLDNQTMALDWVGSNNAQVILSAADWSAAGQVTITPTTPSAGDTNLSNEGNLDWEHIGFPTDATNIAVKQGVTGPRLGSITAIGGAPITTTTPGKTFTWTDAPPPGLYDVTTKTDPVTIVNGTDDDAESGPPPAAETEIHSFDNDTQKYLNFLDLNSGVIVTPAANGGQGTVVTGVRFYTANDAVERDPASYTLEGSNDGGVTWTSISAGDLALPDGRNQAGHVPDPNIDFNQTLTFTNNALYKLYRARFPTIKNSTAANSMQIGEIELLHASAGNAPATSDADAISGNGNGFHLTVPAGPVLRRVKLYVGIDGNGTGTLTATMSDGSVAPVTFTPLNDTNASGVTTAVYQIDFRAALNNQALSLNWIASNGGTAVISAASWIELTAPTAPLSVKAIPTSPGKINVSWQDTAANETGFVIERAPDNSGTPGTFEAVGTAKADITQFVDSGLFDSTIYYYRVSAVNPVGSSPALNVASTTTLAAMQTGITAKYWNDPNNGVQPTGHLGSAGDGVVFTETEPNINVNWNAGSPNPAVTAEYFSSQWDGTFTADYTGPTTFLIDTDDGGRFFIDTNQNGAFDWDPTTAGTNSPQGELVVNIWSDHGLGITGGTTVNLVAGQQYKIRMQQFEHTGGAAAFLYVQTPFGGANPVIVPTENLSPADTVMPRVVGAPEIDRAQPATETFTPKQHIVVHFSEPIALVNATISVFSSDGTVYTPSVVIDNQNNALLLTFPTLPLEELPNGNYRLFIGASGVQDLSGNRLDGNGDGLGDDYVTAPENAFYILKGDTQSTASGAFNGDRKVSVVDFQRLELGFGKTAVNRPAAADGDVNHDGVVDRGDLQIILAAQGSSVPLPLASAPVPSKPVSLPAPPPAPVITTTKPVVVAKVPVPAKKPVVVKLPPAPVKKPVPIVVAMPPAKVTTNKFSTTRVSGVKNLLSSK